MCGIVGYCSYSFNLSSDEFKNAIKSLKHRGPDNEGYFQENNVGLGHTRLSIIDLSSLANQPMFSKNKQYVIVYNGEVYNFNEIAKKYQLQIQTKSDTEVILEAFAIKGTDIVKEFNGMFAIAIYDKINNTFTLFRDRIGKKPLYYFFDNNFFAFASEIKALLEFSYIKSKLSLNLKAINYYLHLGFIPEPFTIYDKIYKFPAASIGTSSYGYFKIFKYWNIEEQLTTQCISDENEAKEQLKTLLYSSIKYRLISDVPYGVFLSGGVDSSLVTAIAQKITGNTCTYSIGFAETKYNEAPYAKAVSDFIKTKHTEFIVSYNDALLLIDNIIDQYDEPFADASAIPTMLVSKLAKNEVSMVLSGDGGDELFWGYGSYHWANRLNNPIIKYLRFVLASFLNLGNSRYKRIAKMFEYSNKDFLPAHILSQELYFFKTSEIIDLLNLNYTNVLEFDLDLYTKRTLNKVEIQSLFDLKYYLKDDLMVKVDRASMKYALEVRSPLLDYRIVEFAYNLSPELKHRNGTDKYLLKQVLFEYLPKSLFDKPKWGFALPLNKWLQNELKPQIKEYFNSNFIKNFNLFNIEHINNLLHKYESGSYYLYGRLWNLYILLKWLEKNKNNQ
jgi:asparagine synthase (glutamine-hydrolysing)